MLFQEWFDIFGKLDSTTPSTPAPPTPRHRSTTIKPFYPPDTVYGKHSPALRVPKPAAITLSAEPEVQNYPVKKDQGGSSWSRERGVTPVQPTTSSPKPRFSTAPAREQPPGQLRVNPTQTPAPVSQPPPSPRPPPPSPPIAEPVYRLRQPPPSPAPAAYNPVSTPPPHSLPPKPLYSGFVPLVGGGKKPSPAAAAPLSLFQSVPENLDETGVFDLSRHTDFGTRLPGRSTAPRFNRGHPAENEVDTGRHRSARKLPVAQRGAGLRKPAIRPKHKQRVRNTVR